MQTKKRCKCDSERHYIRDYKEYYRRAGKPKKTLSSKLEEFNQLSPLFTLEMFESALKSLTDMPATSLIDSVVKRINLFSDYIIVYFRLFDIDDESPEKVRISFNVTSPPPNVEKR